MRAVTRFESASWWPALAFASATHAAFVIYLLLPEAAPKPPPPADGPPLAVTLAAPASVDAPPADAAIAERPSPDAAEQRPVADRPPPIAPGPNGTITVSKANDAAKPAPPSIAPSSAAAAAPSPIAGPPANQIAAPVESASSQLRSATATWESQVAARLEKAKRFPLSARMGNKQDTLIVSFTVDAQGRTSHARIRRSAGYEDLEDEVLDLVARISPLPPPPDRGVRQIVVPIQFRLDR